MLTLRTVLDFPCLAHVNYYLFIFFVCLVGLCKIFEEHLKLANPGKAQITYDIAQLFDFIDQLTDLCCLV